MVQFWLFADFNWGYAIKFNSLAQAYVGPTLSSIRLNSNDILNELELTRAFNEMSLNAHLIV